MTRPLVLASIEAADGVHCIDVRQLNDETYDAALCRRDPEDPHGWRVLEVRPLQVHKTKEAACAAALEAFGWSE
ncbi:hypothetical protein [Marivita hallyeonensis]|uniref:Uncharacterized protein n=1 Tax=Marivita hallyeonensis TaxID=996342 RepID=A0A1M5VIT3_9RHOB|nr:hypothetical protein [Marivita hallyeonensis]SHH75137.1 hypothetical protein SAMN05443551_2895 [Marivita hallyeonensis]